MTGKGKKKGKKGREGRRKEGRKGKRGNKGRWKLRFHQKKPGEQGHCVVCIVLR